MNQAVEKAAEKELEVGLGSIIERVLARNEA
jgi:hypothetical protein